MAVRWHPQADDEDLWEQLETAAETIAENLDDVTKRLLRRRAHRNSVRMHSRRWRMPGSSRYLPAWKLIALGCRDEILLSRALKLEAQV